jgi:hypothetical protein
VSFCNGSSREPVVSLGGVAAIAVWKIVLPLRRLPTDMQLAKFVERRIQDLRRV